MNIKSKLEEAISLAMEVSGISDGSAMIGPSAKPQFGDYQANGVMAAAKKLKTNPRELAEKVISAVRAGELGDICEKLEVAGPGFINITLKNDWIFARLAELLPDERLGVAKPDEIQNVVVDYSAPNIAKEMHVGHLRSTIIGDSLARTLHFKGYKTIRQNHVGDWGTQFGRVILGMWHICMEEVHGERYIADYLDQLQTVSDEKEKLKLLVEIRDMNERNYKKDSMEEANMFLQFVENIEEKRGILPIPRISAAYQFASKVEELAKDTDIDIPVRTSPDSLQQIRIPYSSLSSFVTSMLQKADLKKKIHREEYHAWAFTRKISIETCEEVYTRLGVLLNKDDIRGESDYRNSLPGVVSKLSDEKLLTESDGAQCVFLDEFQDKEGEIIPIIVRKSNGGFLYATTDLAAILYRVNTLHAERILYVTDARQSLHFKQIFALAHKGNFAPPAISLEHVAFGMMMGTDGKPFKTRQGGTIKLIDLLDEAEQRAFDLVTEKNPSMPIEDRKQIARVVGIGSVKYADLAQNRTSDYIFSWDKMLSFDGNTAPYLQYAYARIRSIFRKVSQTSGEFKVRDFAPAERTLALKLMRFSETVDSVAEQCMPNILCAYLFDLAGSFMSFYESCPVIGADNEDTRSGRLALCSLTAETIKKGLNLLGIETIEKM